MRKRLKIILMLVVIMLSSFSANAREINITIDGKSVPLENNAFIIDNRTYVPMREVFENIGADVLWNDEEKSATAIFNNSSVTFKIDNNIITKNGESFKSDNNCKLVDGKTYIPVRVILELLGFSINWSDKDNNVDISPPAPIIPDTESTDQPVIESGNEYEAEVLRLINEERNKKGLANLSMNSELSMVARAHSKDMYDRGFFSHTNPDGLSPFDRIKNKGISYKYAAENIAVGQKSPEQVVNSWMNSEGHKKNILNPDFKKIGIGYFKADSGYIHYWTQCFTD